MEIWHRHTRTWGGAGQRGSTKGRAHRARESCVLRLWALRRKKRFSRETHATLLGRGIGQWVDCIPVEVAGVVTIGRTEIRDVACPDASRFGPCHNLRRIVPVDIAWLIHTKSVESLSVTGLFV